MFGIEQFQLFLLACVMLNITPGQDTMYILGRSAAQGKRAGIVSALGIMAGILIHTLLAATGLSVILSTSAPAFAVVKLAGAVYLIWLGIGFLLTSGIWFLVLVNAAAWLSSRLRSRSAVGRVIDTMTGVLFIGLGIRLAVSRAP